MENQRAFQKLAALACAAKPGMQIIGVGGIQSLDSDFATTGVEDNENQFWQVICPQNADSARQMRQGLGVLMKLEGSFSRLPFKYPRIVASARSIEGYHAVLFPALDGQALEAADLEQKNPKLAAALGQALAALHDLPSSVGRVAGAAEVSAAQLRALWQDKLDFVREANELAQQQTAQRLRRREQGHGDGELFTDDPVNDGDTELANTAAKDKETGGDADPNSLDVEHSAPQSTQPVTSAQQISTRPLRALGRIPSRLFLHWQHQLSDPQVWDFSTCLIHDNLDFHQILRNEAGDLSIQGWEKLSLNDPARDLAWILSVADPAFTATVFQTYHQQRPLADAQLLQRTELTAELLLLDWLYHGLLENDTQMTADGYQMLRQLHDNLMDSPDYRALDSSHTPGSTGTTGFSGSNFNTGNARSEAATNSVTHPTSTVTTRPASTADSEANIVADADGQESVTGVENAQVVSENQKGKLPPVNPDAPVTEDENSQKHSESDNDSDTAEAKLDEQVKTPLVDLQSQVQNRIKTQAISTADIRRELQKSRWDREQQPEPPAFHSVKQPDSESGE